VLYTDRNRRDGYDVSSSYVKCNNCDFVYLDPIVDFKYFSGWDEVYTPELSSDRSQLLNYVTKIMSLWNRAFDRTSKLHSLPSISAKENGRRRRILDVGCNDGARLASFAKRGWQIWGVDMSKRSIDIATERFTDGCFSCGDFLELELPNDYFDVIRSDAVWEHVEDPLAFIKKAHGLLRPGGQLFLYVPNYASLLQKFCGKYNINSWVPFHINYFTRTTARKALELGGFPDCRIMTNTYPGYFPLTAKQYLYRNRGSFDVQNLGWLVLLFLICSPLHLLPDTLGWGEELVIHGGKQ
jgi:2-polyprenyl-3-methyl-5-hydroxy-6-metoxy-1,4-benzoquinol methylase